MNTLIGSRLGWLRIIAFLEGVSFLILLGIAMPLKYLAGLPEMVRMAGMAHGVLFMAYVPLVLYVKLELDWPIRKTLLALIASVIPFGTFWADARLFRESTVQVGVDGAGTGKRVREQAPPNRV